MIITLRIDAEISEFDTLERQDSPFSPQPPRRPPFVTLDLSPSFSRLSPAPRSSAFATPASASLLRATPRTIVVPRASVVVSAKGKSSRRSSATPNMPQQPPTPPVDPDNAEFIIFVRSKKLPSWIPFTLIKSGATANVLVKTLETTPDNQTVKDTLIRNIGNALYGDDYAKINAQAKRLLPQLKFAKELEYGFKIRDKVRRGEMLGNKK